MRLYSSYEVGVLRMRRMVSWERFVASANSRRLIPREAASRMPSSRRFLSRLSAKAALVIEDNAFCSGLSSRCLFMSHIMTEGE